MTAILYCPHDGSRLSPLEGTPNWFQCGAEGWKHYFYRGELREMIDVDTDKPVPKKRTEEGAGLTIPSRFSGFDPEFDGVYAAIASALRSSKEEPGGPRAKARMTKGRVAAVHRRMLAGEALDTAQEQDIARRLRQQLGAPEGPRDEAIGDGAKRDGAGPVGPGAQAE